MHVGLQFCINQLFIVYLYLDLPIIVSGEYVGILDPHRKYINQMQDDGTVESGWLLRLSHFCSNASHASLLNGMFSFESGTREFKGTIFRFPFRKQGADSRLSDTVYSAEKAITDLYQSFKLEAERILLFLKHVTTIELYSWDSKVLCQQHYLSVTISPTSLPDVNQMRVKAESHCKCSLEESSSATTILYTCRVEVTCPADGSDRLTYNWLICNTVGTSKASLKHMAQQLKVAPWVGVAVQVPTEFVLATGYVLDWKDFSESVASPETVDIRKAYEVLQRELDLQLVEQDTTSPSFQCKGYAFCFLPLPDPTGLPVSVHGYFSVADNRRSIKWPAPDVKGNDAKWNEELVHTLVVPSYAILLATRTRLFSFSSHGDSPYSWWPNPQCVASSQTWSSLIPGLSTLLLQLPIFWTGADGGKWVSQDSAIFLPPECPQSVADLLLKLGFAAVHIPDHVVQCLYKGKNEVQFASALDVCQYLKQKSTETKALMSSEIIVEFLRYFTNSGVDHSNLVGLPIILLNDVAFSAACLHDKGQEGTLYVMLDKSNAAMLPGLENRIVSFDVPHDIAELYTALAKAEKFQLQIAQPTIVASSLLCMSMRTWCNPDAAVLWTPDKQGHPSQEWLTNVWEWLAKQEVASKSTTEFAVMDIAKDLPIVPVESLDDSALAETVLLPLSDAVTGAILQMPQAPNEDSDFISCICHRLGIKIVQFSSALNKLAYKEDFLPGLSPFTLLHALMKVDMESNGVSEAVRALEIAEKDKLKNFLEPSIETEQVENAHFPALSDRIDFLKSIPFHTIKDRSDINHSALKAQIIFVTPEANPPDCVQLSQPLLCYSASELGFYKVLLGRNPDSLTTLVQNHILPHLQEGKDNAQVFLWIFEMLCESDSDLITTLKGTAFLPSCSGSVHRPCELFDPEDKKLSIFLGAGHFAHPHQDFIGHRLLVRLRWLGMQTWSQVCSTKESFIRFVLTQAQSLVSIPREEGLKKSNNLINEVVSNEFCEEALMALGDVPFLFCEVNPPFSYVYGLPWFGQMCAEKIHTPAEICASTSSDLSCTIGSVCPILSTEYKNTTDLAKICCKATPVNVVAQWKNVVCLPDDVLQSEENKNRVTSMMHQVYSYLNNDATSVNELDAPSRIWHPQQAQFVPLDKVVLNPAGLLHLTPYRFNVNQLDNMEQHIKLWKALGMRETFDDSDCEEVLLEIQTTASAAGLTPGEMKVVHSILQYLKNKGHSQGALLPTTRNGLMDPLQCVFDDREWLAHFPELASHYIVVLNEIPRQLAQYFGAVPLSQIIASPKPLEINVTPETRPVEALVRERLSLYQPEVDPFLDLIQVADYAGATSVKFIFDWRSYAKQSLFSEEMAKLQGPSLFVLLNTVLNEDTVKNLCSIGSLQQESPESCPHLPDGCDFCSAYHLSDLPMLWNGNKLLVFDPLQAHVSHLTAKPSHGVQFDTVQSMTELQTYYSDQLNPFLEVLNCYSSKRCILENNHALFRFPFRNAPQVSTGALSNFAPQTAKEIVSGFIAIADSLPVFLQSVMDVEFCELELHARESRVTSLLSVIKATTPVPQNIQCAQSGHLKTINVKSKLEEKELLSEWLVVSQPSPGRIHVDIAVSVVQDSSSFLLTPPPKRHVQNLFSNVILNHTVSPWPNCLVNISVTTDGKQVQLWPRVQSDVLIDAASDSVSNALLSVLTIAQRSLHPSTLCQTEQSLADNYYGLWPTDAGQVAELLHKADSAQVPVVCSVEGTWECLRSCVVMSEEFRQTPLVIVYPCLQEILKHTGHKIADIPESVMKLVLNSVKAMDFETFCEQVFFCNIQTLPRQEMQSALFFMLENYQLLHSMNDHLDEQFKRHSCIPTAPLPHGQLIKPQELVDQSSLTIGKLYSEEDGRFVSSCNRKIKSALKELGMKCDKLTDEDVLDRAHSVFTVVCHGDAQERSRRLLNYLFTYHQCDESLGNSLSEILFLPAAQQQTKSLIPWRADKSQLYRSVDLYLPHFQKLVFTQCPVLDPSIDPRCHDVLHFKGKPPTKVVLDHLVALVECVSEEHDLLNEEDWKAIDESAKAVYNYLNHEAQQNADTLKAAFDVAFCERGMIWDGTDKCFVKQDVVALSLPSRLSTLSPYRKTQADLECLRQYGCLWQALEVKEQFIVHDCAEVLCEMKDACSEQPLAEEHIRMVVDILWFMQSQERKDGALIPTSRGSLCSPDKAVFDDRRWSEKNENLQSRFTFAHKTVPAELAKYFGVHPVSSKIASPRQLKLKLKVKESGQRESLTRRLRGIVEDYKDNIDVFKELIQNADDAGATKVKFLLDWRQHPRENLFTDELGHWQGPALYAYNDSVFSDEDFANICELGGATKKCDPLKIGRFGLGFCATYHLTDVPSFVSRTQLTIFDPHRQYIKDIMVGDSPGLCVDILEERSDLQEFLSGHVAVYEDLFGCSLLCLGEDGFNGTLFRFPFRTQELAEKSEISSTVINQSNVAHLTAKLYSAADTLLVFLRNVTNIELYELLPNSHPSNMEQLLSVTKKRLDVPADLIQRRIAQDISEGDATPTLELQKTHESMSRFIIAKRMKDEADEVTNWLAVPVLDGRSGSRPLNVQPSEHILFAEVAVQIVEHSALWMPCPVKGYLHCFLPLPISTDLKVLINGYFEVSKDRRSLTDVQDKSRTDTWNVNLISGAIATAYVGLLVQLLKLNGSSCEARFVEAFYKLWPTVLDQDPVAQILVPHFFSKLLRDSYPVVPTVGQEWVSISAACVLDDLFTEKVPDTIRSSAVELLLKCGYKLTNIPTSIQNTVRRAGQNVTVITFKEYSTECLFPAIGTLDEAVHDDQVLFVLREMKRLDDSSKWLFESLRDSKCIPCEPKCRLVPPSNLIDRNSPLACLFDSDEERFPAARYSEPAVVASLRELGMKYHTLEGEQVIERAQFLHTLVGEERKKRISDLLNYLFGTHLKSGSDPEYLLKELSKVPFLLAAVNPSITHLPWSGNASQLYCPVDLYLPEFQKLVFTQCPVLDSSVDARCHETLQFKGEPPINVVLDHLVALVECVSEEHELLNEEDWRAIDESAKAVYNYLNHEAQQNADTLKATFDVAFRERGMIWDGTDKCFVKQDVVALSLPSRLSTLSPYRKTQADLECLRQFGCLWQALKVKEQFIVHDCVEVLCEMKDACSEQPLAEQHIRMVVDILWFMQNQECKDGALIPTSRGSLCSPDKAVFDDCRWSEKNENLQSRFTFAHKTVPAELAKYFGVHPVSSKIASPRQLKLKLKVKESGQRESLTRRLRGIVEDYKDNIDVFKELIQNADDAGATKVKFLLDWRQHPRENLFTDELGHWQGPALYAYNDSVFSDEDFANICELGGATKKCDPLKIGRFGLGFCATYHLTDVPSFVSRTQLTIFDPHRQYIKDIMVGDSPGLCVDILEERSDLQEFLSGHVAVYEDLFGCSLLRPGEDGFDGTLFRFPFRTQELAEKSEISSTVIDQSNVAHLTAMLYSAADTLLVFLRNVTNIELYELQPNSHPSNMEQLLSVTKKRLDVPADLIQRYITQDISEGTATPTPELQKTHESMSRFIIVKQMKDKAEEMTNWLAVSILDSRSDSRPLNVQPSEHIPFAEVAVQIVERSSLWMPCPVKGNLHCFLPLPISTDLKVLINGYFEVSKDRRSLTDVQDKSRTDTWNVHLISGAIATAYVVLLAQLLKLNGSSCEARFVEAFYKLWPTVLDQDPVAQILVPHFFSKLLRDSHPVVPTVGQEWVSISAACVLDDLFTEKVPDTIRSSAVEVLLKCGYKLTNIPTSIQNTVRQVGQNVTVITFKEYSTECLFPAIGTLDEAVRDKQVLFILREMRRLDDSSKWLLDLLCDSKCIPCEPEGRLVSPSNLIDQNSPLACLFDNDEERFPASEYSEPAVVASLRELGMKYHTLEGEQVIERAQSIHTLVDEEQKKRISDFLNYLFGTHLKSGSDQESLLEHLSEVPFLLAAVNSSIAHLPWSGNASQLYCPVDLYLPEFQKLVFTQCPVLDSSVDARCHETLQFKGEPPINVVLDHLVALVECVSEEHELLNEEDWKAIDESAKAVYNYLNHEAQQNADTLKAMFDVAFHEGGMIWDGTDKCFVKQDVVALSLPSRLSTLNPYRKTQADLECLRQYSCLWKALEVKEQFKVHDCVEVLCEMKDTCSEQPLAEQHIRMAVDILWFMQNQEYKDGALIPTSRGGLCFPDKAVFDDRRWSEKNENLQSRFTFAHNTVPAELAKYFGVHPVSSKIASPRQLKLKLKVKESGQRESLTRRLRGIVEDYKDNIDVFKELIQNADDAGATKVKFLLDWRQHPKENLFTDELGHWQGPALYAYNDSVFSDEDFANICELGGATKKCDPLKIGRFGLGFCATYHLTDVPSFVSRTQLTIFDPHRQYIKDIMVGDSPGLCVDILEERSDLQEFLSGHVAVYEDLFGCSLLRPGEDGFNGTLFRFPFRTQELAEKSEISSTVIDQSNVALLTAMLYNAADTLLVFLRNVTNIELYELPPDSHPSNMKQRLSVTKEKLDSPADLVQSYVTQDISEDKAMSTSELPKKSEAVSRFIIVNRMKDKAEEETRWLAVSVLDSAGDSRPLNSKTAEHIPFAEVAVQVAEDNSLWMPYPVKGYLHCFLPLPISTDLKVLINGYFEVSKDRRSLTDIQDKSQTDTWNTKLISGAVTTAYTGLLVQLLKLNRSSCEANFVQAFYNLWPSVLDRDPVAQILVPHFFSKLLHDSHLVVPTVGQEWVSISAACVLDDLFTEKVPDTIRSSAVELLLKCGYKLANIPTSIQDTVRQVGQNVTVITFKEYSIQCLFPVIDTFDEAVRDDQILFVLSEMRRLDDSSKWLLDLLCDSKCIPCEPKSRLVPPSHLIEPNSPLACLFNSDEERFPTSKYSEPAVVTSLRELGMKYHTLEGGQVIERAKSIRTLVDEERKKRISDFLNYLFGTHLKSGSDQESLLEHLSEVPFLLAAVNPSIAHLPWSGNANQLYCPVDLYLPEFQKLVFTQCPVLDSSVDARCHETLQFKGEPPIIVVLDHLVALVECVSEEHELLNEEDWKAIDESAKAVYNYLNHEAQQNADTLKATFDVAFHEGGMIWDGTDKCFVKQDVVALSLPSRLSTLNPYRKTQADLECLRQYGCLWHTLEVKEQFKVHDCVEVLREMKDTCSEQPLAEQHIRMAVDILWFMKTQEYKDGALIPTSRGSLCFPDKAVFDDRRWSEKNENLQSRFTFAHNTVPAELAKYFGVHPVSSKIASPRQLKLKLKVKESGQRESLTRRLRGIVEDYKDNIDVFKELIQNADDAGATKVKFLLDWRQHPKENLLTDELGHWQGPAMVWYGMDILFQ